MSVSNILHLESLGDGAAVVGGIDLALCFKNFHAVASRPVNGVELFFRNVPMLLDLSMTIGDYSLASELGKACVGHAFIPNSFGTFTCAIILCTLLNLRFVPVYYAPRYYSR